MRNKLNNIMPIIAVCIILTTLFTFIVSSFPTISPVYAWSNSTGYTGKEDPEKLSDFNDSVQAQNKFKCWSIYKGMGMTDNQAIAAMACLEAESHYRSELIEGSDPLKLGGLGDTGAEAEAYIKNYSQKMDTDASFRTSCTDAILYGYGINADTIERCHNGDRSGDSTWTNSKGKSGTLSLSTYYDEAGVGWLGCGLYQFTGGSLKGLFAWSSSTGYRWFEFDNQMAYFMADPSLGGYKGDKLQQWISESKSMSLDKCVDTFFHTMINGNDLPDFVAQRVAIATTLYPEFVGVSWNQKYANKILAMCNLNGISVRQGIQDRSILYSYASAVAYYPRNNGFIINLTENNNVEKRNEEVFKGYINRLNGKSDINKSYSLFELYGEDLHWYRYMGEATYTPKFLDHIWSAVDQNKVKELVSAKSIKYDAYNYLSCNVYPNRPEVLSIEDKANGEKDPRVSALSVGWFNGFFYVSGSIKFTIAKWIVAITSYLTGPEIRETFLNILNYLESTELWQILKAPILVLLGLGMLFFIISLARKGIKYAKGDGSAREAIVRFFTGVICLGFLFAILARPAVFNKVIDRTVNIVDSVFTATLTATLQNDDIINVTNDNLAVHAVLWKNAIFRPWCRGQFDNTNYEDLYTHFAEGISENHMLPQDNEDVDTSDTTGKAFYNSVDCTGDVYVPTGNGKDLRNWAAYLYSCGSKYHIDSTINSENAEDINISERITFPHYTTKTTAENPDLNADLFRVIDAQMNISPQYFANGSKNNNYIRANSLNTHYNTQGFVALLNASLLLFMFPVIIKKLIAFIMLMTTTIKMIIFSIMEIFKENSGFTPFIDSVKKDFIDYVSSCIKLNIMITLYYICVDHGIMKLFIYIVLCIVLLSISWDDVRYFKQNMQFKLKKFIKHL